MKIVWCESEKGKKNFDWFNNKKNMKMLCDAINTKNWASQFSQLKNYHTNTKHTEFTSIQRSVDESAIWKNNKQVKPAQSLESDWVGAQREFITFFPVDSNLLIWKKNLSRIFITNPRNIDSNEEYRQSIIDKSFIVARKHIVCGWNCSFRWKLSLFSPKRSTKGFSW